MTFAVIEGEAIDRRNSKAIVTLCTDTAPILQLA
jgi:hypothetical protein